MTKRYTLLFLLPVLLSFIADSSRKVPSVDVKSVDGKIVNTSSFSNNGKPYLIAFFATWCKPCKEELNDIAEVYTDWQKETGVKLIAVSLDDSKSSSKIKPFVDANSWDYEVYHDFNQDFKRALSVLCSPHLFLVNNEGNIVWEHSTYKAGDENLIYKKVKECAGK